MKLKKRYIVLAAIVGAIAGGVYYVSHNLENIVKSAVNKYGSQVTGTEVKLGGFYFAPFKGEVKLNDLTVANPKGYAKPYIISLGEVFVKLNVKSLTEPVIVVEKVSVVKPEVTYELKNVTNNNVSDLLANINKNTASEDKAETPKEVKKEEKSGEGKKVVVDLVSVSDGQVNIAASIAGKGTGAGIPLPNIEIKDIGKEKDKSGKSLSETVVVILKKILNTSYQAVVEKGLGGLKDVANDGIKALNDKADSLKDEAKGFLKNIF
ncbi:MAG: hypothetical protein IKV11_03105 [Alphaproteobacteria bacterium]|nr:hypothetical protein [Alphaproteobacteria bacterium]